MTSWATLVSCELDETSDTYAQQIDHEVNK